MKSSKYKGIMPALYACYDKDGNIDLKTVKDFSRHLVDKGCDGLYVGGSSGECIYQNIEERKLVLEAVMEEVGGEVVVIAHVACNSTRDSVELAKHANAIKVDAIAAIPPIYFKVGNIGVAKYWNEISAAAPDTDFIIYNIPQLTGVALNHQILDKLLPNKNLVGVKNSSMATFDIYDIIDYSNDSLFVFNGPDEQLVSGLSSGATGGIGGTYGLMPELYIKLYDFYVNGETEKATRLQYDINKIIAYITSSDCSMYAVIKRILHMMHGFDFGGVRPPLVNLSEKEEKICELTHKELVKLYDKYVNKK